MTTLNVNESNLEFLKQLVQTWSGPGVYRFEKLENIGSKNGQVVIFDSSNPRHRIYRPAILRALFRKGGQAHVSELKPLILNDIRHKLTERELNDTKSNRPFWWYDCQVERYALVQEGIIEDGTSVGYWTLTTRGRAAAEKLSSGDSASKNASEDQSKTQI